MFHAFSFAFQLVRYLAQEVHDLHEVNPLVINYILMIDVERDLRRDSAPKVDVSILRHIYG